MENTTILNALKEYGSENVQSKLKEKGGAEFCTSYIQKYIQQGTDFETSLGWLEQDLGDIN